MSSRILMVVTAAAGVSAVGLLTHLTRHVFHGPAVVRALLVLVLCCGSLAGAVLVALIIASAAHLLLKAGRRGHAGL